MSESGATSGLKVFLIVLVVAALVGLLVCGGAALWVGSTVQELQDLPPEERMQRMQETFGFDFDAQEAVVQSFLDAAGAGDLDAAYALTDEQFQGLTDREQFARVQQRIDQVLGPLESHAMTNVNVNHSTGTRGTGTVYQLTYTARYANAEATLVLHLAEQDDESVLVQRYQVNSPLFDEVPLAPQEPAERR